MFLFVTGAEGAGKTTARRAIREWLLPHVYDFELGNIVALPSPWTLAGWHQSLEYAVQRALELQVFDYDVLFCGDSIVLGELLAAPSAPKLNAIAICLLDVQPHRQRERLARCGTAEALIDQHVAFAEWIRKHMGDPQHHPEVIMTDGWDQMQWERWRDWEASDPRWQSSRIDTSDLTPAQVAAALYQWCNDALYHRDVPMLIRHWTW